MAGAGTNAGQGFVAPAVRRRVERIELGDRSLGTPHLPLIRLEGAREGPCVAVTANVHGDEVTGLAAVHALDRRLQGALAKGAVLLVPSLNVQGLMAQRRVQPADGHDLNRAFPGDSEGRGATRVAGRVWQALLSAPLDAAIDLHADSAVAIPYAIVDRAPHLRGESRRRMDAALVELASASGLTILHEYPDDLYVKFRLDRSLAGAMVNHGEVPAVTLEVGPRRAVALPAVDQMVLAVLRILGHLGLVEGGPPLPAGPCLPGGPWRRAAAPRVRSAGVFVPLLAPGEAFAYGDLLGEVRAVDGTVREVLRAPAAGIVVSWSESAWVDPRGVPGTLGLVTT